MISYILLLKYYPYCSINISYFDINIMFLYVSASIPELAIACGRASEEVSVTDRMEGRPQQEPAQGWGPQACSRVSFINIDN